MTHSATDNVPDVVIVGGGMVGLLLALSLARQSTLRVLLLEELAQEMLVQGSVNSFDGRSTALSRTTAALFRDLQLGNVIEAHSATISDIVASERRGWGRFRLNADEEGVDALGYVVENASLGQELLRAAMQCPGIQLRFSCSVQSIEMQAERTTLHVAGQAPVTTSLLVAADGAHSRLRQAMGIPVDVVDYAQSALVCNIRLSSPVPGLAIERFAPGEVVAVLPRLDGSRAVIWTAAPERVQQLKMASERRFSDELTQYLGTGQGRVLQRTPPVLYPLKKIIATQQVQPGRVVLGNAAHFLHPVAGQGFNLCVRDVQLLTQLLLEAWHQQRPLGSLALLQQYQQSRSRDQQIIGTFSDALVRLGTASFPGLRFVRSLGMSVLDQWPLSKRLLARMTMGAV